MERIDEVLVWHGILLSALLCDIIALETMSQSRANCDDENSCWSLGAFDNQSSVFSAAWLSKTEMILIE